MENMRGVRYPTHNNTHSLLRMSLFSRRESYLGLDIGTSSVKLVELVREGRSGVRLSTYAVANGTIPLGEGSDGDAIARIAMLLRAMAERAQVTSENVVAALPSLSVFSSVITLPNMSGRDLDQAVTLAAKNYVPSPLKDVVLGWTTIEDAIPAASGSKATPPSGSPQPTLPPAPTSPPVKERKHLDIFLTAAPKDLVQRYSSVIERLNYRLVALEVESFPLSRSLLGKDMDPALLVDIGDRATSFSIVDRGYLRLNQSVDIGGATLTLAVTQRTGLSAEAADQKKRSSGLLGGTADAVSEAMRPVVRDLIERARNLRRLYEQKSLRSLRRVVLIGGGANLPALPAVWTEMTGLPTVVGNPWSSIIVPAQLQDRLRTLGPSFAVAVGLALREFEQAR